MTRPPKHPKIYHITHVDNLPGIIAGGELLSDAEMTKRGGPAQPIGMSTIKRRRLTELAVPCHPGTHVGDYVPFYFCPRSVMLYVIHCANHPQLTYRGGQEPIVHLQADLCAVVNWADSEDVRWAFSLSNAGACYTEFRSQLSQLDELDWRAIAAKDFRNPDTKERKQAEFLIHTRFPFILTERIGVLNSTIASRVKKAIVGTNHTPAVCVRPDWYF